MNEERDALQQRIFELLGQGYHCSQVMMILSMEMRGIEDDFTVRALGALGGGMFCQRTCGTLTGGVCMISSHYPREEGDPEPTGYQAPAAELVAWFEETNGSVNCCDLVEFNRESIMAYCPALMHRTFQKCVEILEEQGIDATE